MNNGCIASDGHEEDPDMLSACYAYYLTFAHEMNRTNCFTSMETYHKRDSSALWNRKRAPEQEPPNA